MAKMKLAIFPFLCCEEIMKSPIWVFHKHPTLAIMPILAAEALLYKNKRNPVTKCYRSGDRTQSSRNL